MKLLDRILACVLGLGAIGHGAGSYLGYRHEPLTMLWALCASILGLLLAAINLLRSGRAADRPLAWICFSGTLAMAASAFAFGALIGNVFDPRALMNGCTALALAGFSLKTAMRSGPSLA
jgi:uncharacterized membrane protein YjjP (DUF1212 family)